MSILFHSFTRVTTALKKSKTTKRIEDSKKWRVKKEEGKGKWLCYEIQKSSHPTAGCSWWIDKKKKMYACMHVYESNNILF